MIDGRPQLFARCLVQYYDDVDRTTLTWHRNVHCTAFRMLSPTPPAVYSRGSPVALTSPSPASVIRRPYINSPAPAPPSAIPCAYPRRSISNCCDAKSNFVWLGAYDMQFAHVRCSKTLCPGRAVLSWDDRARRAKFRRIACFPDR